MKNQKYNNELHYQSPSHHPHQSNAQHNVFLPEYPTPHNLFDQFPLPQLYNNTLLKLNINTGFSSKLDFNNDQYQSQHTPKLKQSTDNSTTIKKYYPQDNHKKNSKGLRKISGRALQIVTQMKQATYKEVATKLLTQIQTSLENDGRDQQNIKRRVYDALNVMIALGILTKQGKKILPKTQSKYSDSDYQTIDQQLQRINKNLSSKYQKLQQTYNIKTVLSNLINRNQSHQATQSQIIKFPFIGCTINDIHKESINISDHMICIKTDKKLKLFGDIDSLCFLKRINNQ